MRPLLIVGVQSCVLFRFTIAGLLRHQFFSSDDDPRVVVHAEKVNSNKMPMQIVFQNKKESGRAKEAIEFTYDLKKDEPNEVATELVNNCLLMICYVLLCAGWGSEIAG